MTRIEKIAKIVADHQAAKIDGILVDAFTAQAILACHEAGNDRTKEIIESAPLHRVAEVAWKAVK